jgi:serine/threonine protein phosphatase 1
MNIQYFEKNTQGTDYIVGDIHGCFEQLATELVKIDFDSTVDRLFSVGDLVDRGPDSIKALEWLKKPWFFPVLGNHEQMAIDFGTYSGMDRNTYSYNGGDWFINLTDEEKVDVRLAFDNLPFMIELNTDIGKIGIIHAEVPTDDWEQAKDSLNKPEEYNNSEAFANVALWARDRIRNNYTVPVKNIDYVVVGHTPMREYKILGNVIYIDTGAYYKGKFTIIRANDLFNMTP